MTVKRKHDCCGCCSAVRGIWERAALSSCRAHNLLRSGALQEWLSDDLDLKYQVGAHLTDIQQWVAKAALTVFNMPQRLNNQDPLTS